MIVTIALGANLGNRQATLVDARRLIGLRVGQILAISPLVETAPWGVTDQPDFLNQLVVVAHPAPAGSALRSQLHQLLDLTQSIENDLGRARKAHWGPRTCDLDLIFVDDLVFESERLSLPHPWWAHRDFVGGLLSRAGWQLGPSAAKHYEELA